MVLVAASHAALPQLVTAVNGLADYLVAKTFEEAVTLLKRHSAAYEQIGVGQFFDLADETTRAGKEAAQSRFRELVTARFSR